MANEILEILKDLRGRDIENVYTSIKNFFDFQNFPMQVIDIVSPYKFLFRTRAHEHQEDFFYNESEISYRKDVLNIKEYGRCNEPLQSLFYCADNNALAFFEVAKDSIKKDVVFPYYTTGVWKVKKNIGVTYILENENNTYVNKELLEMTTVFKTQIIPDPNLLGNKGELLDFLQYISNEFRVKYASVSDYFLSCAYSNYLLTRTFDDGRLIEGIIYPTCLGENVMINAGLNYVFNPKIVGFGKEIELVDVYRSRMLLNETEGSETDILHCKNIDKTTGIISW